MKKLSMFIVIILLSGIQAVNAQVETRYERQEAAGKIIDAELRSLYGAAYSAPFVYEVDSLLGYDGYFLNPLEDPYGTLKRCFIFIGGPEGGNENVVGVYKDGRILWHSDTLNCLPGLNLFTTRDLNDEGKVDLVFEAGIQESELWIFSWDGKTGKRINTVNEDGSSAINVDWGGGFSFIDVEGDGVWEITGRVSEDSSASWSWNGQEYGQWPNTPNTNILFPPTNKISLSVACEVKNNHDTLWFDYTLFNELTSKQRVQDIRIWSECHNVVGVSSPPYWGFSSRSGRGYGWHTWIDYTTGQIRVGKSMSGFSVKANALCAIEDFDSHGYNEVGWNKAWIDKPGNFKLMMQNQLDNAFHGKTIGPADPPSPFVPLDFLDTLISYKHQSVTLGWLRNDRSREQECEQTMRSRDWYMKEEVGKMGRWEVNGSWDFDRDWNNGIIGILDRRLEMAKKALTRGDSAQARRDLQIFAMEVELVNRLGGEQEDRDQKPVMTSEAYALLKYNAEYLIDRLPEREGKHEGERNGKR